VVITEFDLKLPEGGTLHAYDTGHTSGPTVFWHHGTPNIGTPPQPLFAASERLGIRWVSYDRPGYGGSTRRPGRTVGSAADYVRRVADELGIERFAVMGHSGGGTHALACAAILADRVSAAVSGAGLAPYGAAGLDWYAGMCASGRAALTKAAEGLAAKEAYVNSGAEYDPEFTKDDLAALQGDWSWFDSVVGPAVAGGPGGAIDDDIAYVTPWDCDPASIAAPVLLLHGGADRIVPSSHGEWLARHIPRAELQLSSQDGHISVITAAEGALRWLRERTA
jgi:pimeloyl-ACP methyl ester carboxylesterase